MNFINQNNLDEVEMQAFSGQCVMTLGVAIT